MARSPRRGALALVAALLLTLAFATQASAATFDVNTTNDTVDTDSSDGVCADADGKCSLRAAVQSAGGTVEDDVINLPAGRYVFAEDAEPLVVFGGVTLNGAGAPDTVVDSDGWNQAFVIPAGSLTASGITVTGGVACSCAGGGGAFLVLPGSSLDLTDSRLTRNEVESDGGAIASLIGAVKLTRVRVDHNSSGSSGGGIWSSAGELDITDSVIEGNSASGDGGGISNESFFCGCPGQGLANGPELGALNVQAQAPSVDEPGRLQVTGTTITDNTAGSRGGAVYNQPFGAIVVLKSIVTNLAAGPVPGKQAIVNSTVSGNTSTAGGGIYHDNGGELDLVSDTIAENHVLRSENDDDDGGNIGAADTVNLRNTIVADGTSWGEHNNCASFSQGNQFVSQGNNLETTGNDEHVRDCNLTASTDKPNTDPKLGLLRDNGGPTPTHALRDGSPAIDAGSNDAGPELDQRGGDRPPAGGSAGDTRDIGAYEAYSLADLSVEAKTGAPNPGTVGSPLEYSLVVRNSGPDKVNGVTVADTLPGGVDLVSADGCTGAVSCALGTLAPGDVKVVRVVVKPTVTGTLTNVATVSAAGVTDTKPANDSASAATLVNAAPIPPQQPPQDQPPADKNVVVNLDGPGSATIDEFMNGIVVEADCKDEACLRRFREHAAINTGATHIAGFNLTISRAVLGRSNTKTRIRLRPCQSGSKNGKRHQRCVRNLRNAARKAGKFKVKIVVSAVDAAGNKDYAKTFVNIKP